VERRGWVTRAVIDTDQLETAVTADLGERRQSFRGGTSRVTGNGQARICERLGVKFPEPTRQKVTESSQTGLRGIEVTARKRRQSPPGD
jgi:hypothetical protein